MVKGVSRQVIVVHSPDPRLFEQAIFILRDSALHPGVTDEALLQEANRLLQSHRGRKKRSLLCGPLWAGAGAAVTGLVWLLTSL